MSESPRCPKCGIQLSADAPAGLCPKCLVLAGFESQSASGDPGPTKLTPPTSGFEPPTVEELAPLFPQLEILELLGKGGMGAVYKARQPGLDRLVAVKILPPEISRDPAFAERFQREARALARLSHPHIVAVYDFGMTSVGWPPSAVPNDDANANGRGRPFYIVMEFVDGANLRQAIQTKTLTSAEALAIVPQICEALQFAHDEGIVHRDIKPENILIDKRGRVKIADFGLAKLLGQDASDHSLTATHQVMGTLRYMAPEQMQGSREVDHRADIYSLGVVFYELLTGELPMGRFAPPSKKVQVDVRLDEIVLRALEQEPEQRYQHASQVRDDVEKVTSTSGTPGPTTSSPAASKSQAADRENADEEAEEDNPLLAWIWKSIPLAAVVLAFFNPWGAMAWTFFAAYCVIAGMLSSTGIGRRKPSDSTSSGAPLTQRRFMVADSANVAQQAVFHFSSLGYELTEQRADVCVFRRGGQWAGLWETDIRKIATRLTVRTAPAADGQRWVSCDWSVRTMGAWITRRDIRQLEAEGEGFQSLLGVAYSQDLPTAGPQSEPRFSRFAIAGALWALFGLLAVIPTLYFIGLNRVWNGTALPTDVIHSEPPLVFSIFMGALLAIGAGAPIGTTIFGSIAIGHIKRSDGRVIGWPLAVTDAIFFPLLAVFAGIAVPCAMALRSVLPLQLIAAAVPSAGVAASICFFIARAAWRTLGPPPNRRGSVAAADSTAEAVVTEPRLSWHALIGAIWAPLFFIATVATVVPSTVHTSHGPGEYTGPAGWQLALMFTLLPLGMLAPFGTTILGAIGITKIKRSEGKLYGLRLAQADALLFPLLVLAGLAGFAAMVILLTAIHWGIDPRLAIKNELPHWFIVLLAVPIWFFPARALFRAVVGPRDAFEIRKLPLVGDEPLTGKAALVVALAAIAAHGWPWHWIIAPPPASQRSMTISNFDVIDALQSFWLLVGSIGLALFASAATLARPAKLILRIGSVIAVIAALVIQVQFFRSLGEWEPGQVGQVARLTRTYSHTAMYVAMVLTGLVSLFLLLRIFDEPSQPTAAERVRRPIGPEQISLWAAISGVVLPALLLIGGIVLSSRVRIPEGFVVVCFILGVGLELIAIGCGISTRSKPSGKARLIIGSIGLVLWLATLATIPTRDSTHDSHPDAISESTLASLPPLGTITNGIGAEFTVPAGQVATFEIVTRRNNETVLIPPHCAYLMASADKPINGQFRWSRVVEEAIAGSHSRWRIEMRSAGGGGGHSEGTLLPDELNAAVGARGLTLGVLEPSVEIIEWGTADVNNLPANGLIGLRVTVVPHGLPVGGSGTGHIDWKRSRSTESTSRRKLPELSP